MHHQIIYNQVGHGLIFLLIKLSNYLNYFHIPKAVMFTLIFLNNQFSEYQLLLVQVY